MKVLILGDCASSGTNVLTGEITGDHKCTVEYSLTWRGQALNDVILWFLRKSKGSRSTIAIDNIVPEAIKYLHEQELLNSYWRHMDVAVVNLSKNGATGGGYFKRLKKYELVNGKPDIIFVTDHTMNHKWQVINHNGKKYFFEKNFDPRYPGFKVNENLESPVEVQRIAYNKAKFNFECGRDTKRNRRVMSWFLRYLDKNNYKYHKLKMYNGFEEFDHGEAVDCSDIVAKYTADHGDIVHLKIEAQPLIAERIINKHPWLTNKSKNVKLT